MSNLNQIYLEEANDLLNRLESALLILDNDYSDREVIDEVFRVMHTFKGNSSMFGYNNIANFVHNLETIYDQVREGEVSLNKELLDITLLAMDHLARIIHDVDLSEPTNQRNNEVLSNRVLRLIDGDKKTSVQISSSSDNKEQSGCFYIYFKPHAEVLKNGTNPLFIVDDLVQLGEAIVVPHYAELEDKETFDPSNCIVFWEVILNTKHTLDEIKDVFVFVEGESELKFEFICSENIDFTDELKKWAKEHQFASENLNISSLKEQFAPVQESNPISVQSNSTKVKKLNKTISSIRVPSDKLDELMNLVSELVTTQAGLTLHAENSGQPQLLSISENVEKLSRQLRDIAFGMTLIPIKNLFGKFQRMVRDTSTELGKKIEFETDGGETELDKTIIESLSDPLMHLLRNSMDHGIETAKERLANNKPEVGRITLKAYYSGAYVNIEISDDGKGIDPENIRKKAIQKELISPNLNLTKNEIYDLIFSPGFSTAEVVTDVSGRGVGMDVVKKNISNLRGEIIVDSEVGKGTTVTIKLPLTLSIIDGLLVNIDNARYVIPLSVVEKCYEVQYSDMLDNFNKLLVLDGVQIPFLNLREEFLAKESNPPEKVPVIVVNNGERQVGLSVDHILGEYQAVLKPLGQYYRDQDFISGATILGDGTIALVLDTNKIINQFTLSNTLEEIL